MTVGPTWTALRIARISTPSLTNKGTAVTSLLLIPVAEVLLIVAVANTYGVADTFRTAYAVVLLGFGTTVVGGIVGQSVRDRQTGALLELLSHRLFYVPYWVSKAAVPVVLGLPVAIGVSVAVLALSGGNSAGLFVRTLLVLPVVAVSASLVGAGVATLSLIWEDPYLVGNLLHAILPITAGVVVPLSSYPAWLAALAQPLPFTAAIQLLTVPHLWDATSLLLGVRECVAAGIFIVLGALATRVVTARMRNGKLGESMM